MLLRGRRSSWLGRSCAAVALSAALSIGLTSCSSPSGPSTPSATPAASVTVSPTAGIQTALEEVCGIVADVQALVRRMRSGSASSRSQIVAGLESISSELKTLAARGGQYAYLARTGLAAIAHLEDSLPAHVTRRDVSRATSSIESAIGALPIACPSPTPTP